MKPGPTKTVKISDDAMRHLKVIAAMRGQKIWIALGEILKREYEKVKP